MPAWPGGPHVHPDRRSPAGAAPGPRAPEPATPKVGAPLRHVPSLPPAGVSGLLAGLASPALQPLVLVGRVAAGLPLAARARARRPSAMLLIPTLLSALACTTAQASAPAPRAGRTPSRISGCVRATRVGPDAPHQRASGAPG